MNAESGVTLLENALRELVGANFDDEMKALVENEHWFAPTISPRELFLFRVRDHVERGSDCLWVFESLRTSERKFLAQKLGIDRAKIVGMSATELANTILATVGLPGTRLSGLKRTVALWNEIKSLVERGEDEKAAVLSRQRAERLLRTLAFFYCSCGYTDTFLGVLDEPGSLRIPDRLGRVLKLAKEEQPLALSALLLEDGWADLGFLALYLRKVSSQLEKTGAKGIAETTLVILSARDHEAFSGLGTALQSYAHDKPTKLDTRRDELLKAVTALHEVINSLIARGVVPDELIVLETCSSVLGPVFRGLLEDGRQLRLTASTPPPLGERILFLPVARRDYARCLWSRSPWPAD